MGPLSRLPDKVRRDCNPSQADSGDNGSVEPTDADTPQKPQEQALGTSEPARQVGSGRLKATLLRDPKTKYARKLVTLDQAAA